MVIANEVEERYKAGNIDVHIPTQKFQSKHPAVDEEQEIRILQAEGADILKTKETREPTVEETIQALRIEEAIIKHNPQRAMELRLEERPHFLGAATIKLLPNESDNYYQRQEAFYLIDYLSKTARKAHENKEPFTAETLLALFSQFNQWELPTQRQLIAKLAKEGKTPKPRPDSTLAELLATAQRTLLKTYKFRQQSEDLGPRYAAYAQGVATVHHLLADIVSSTQTIDAAAHNRPHATPK